MAKKQETLNMDQVLQQAVNNPFNKWAEETNNERYILTLLLSIINVSCKTVDIVSKLPKLTF